MMENIVGSAWDEYQRLGAWIAINSLLSQIARFHSFVVILMLSRPGRPGLINIKFKKHKRLPNWSLLAECPPLVFLSNPLNAMPCGKSHVSLGDFIRFNLLERLHLLIATSKHFRLWHVAIPWVSSWGGRHDLAVLIDEFEIIPGEKMRDSG
jgi:hypothetical protein